MGRQMLSGHDEIGFTILCLFNDLIRMEIDQIILSKRSFVERTLFLYSNDERFIEPCFFRCVAVVYKTVLLVSRRSTRLEGRGMTNDTFGDLNMV